MTMSKTFRVVLPAVLSATLMVATARATAASGIDGPESPIIAGTLASHIALGASTALDRPRTETLQQAALEVSEKQPLADVWPTLSSPWLGDLEGIVERGEIRVLTTLTLGDYFIYKGKQAGFVYWGARSLEAFARERLGKEAKLLKVDLIPVRGDQLIPFLVAGYGDLAWANLTVTPSRLQRVDFSVPLSRSVREILVTGPAAPSVENLEDLADKEVAVSAQTSYHESLATLNDRLRRRGRPEVRITRVDRRLTTEGIIEMVQAGLLPMTVVDDHRAQLWTQVFDTLQAREDIVLRDGGHIAIAVRKDAPKLKALVDDFVRERFHLGTLEVNAIMQRYLGRIDWVHPALERDPFLAFERLAGLFREYGQRYRFDWVLLASVAYQESGFDQNARSGAGAVGVMQLLPSTAADPAVGVRNIEDLENNIHAGAKYLSLLRDRYFSDEALEPFERMLFTLAGYNAGPNRINRLRRAAAERGLNPDKWFGNVEKVVAAKIGMEPVRYVGNIYRYYVAYKRALEELRGQKAAAGRVGPSE